MSAVPNKPDGATRHVMHHRALHDRVYGPDQMIKSSNTVKASRDSSGRYSLDVVSGGGAAPVAAGLAMFPFKIYEVPLTVGQISPTASGQNYVQDEVVMLDGGTNTQPVTLRLSVDDNGSAYIATVVNAGNYSARPAYPQTVSGGSGTGLQFSIPWKQNIDGTFSCGAGDGLCFQIRSGVVGWRSKFFISDPLKPEIDILAYCTDVLSSNFDDPATQGVGASGLDNQSDVDMSFARQIVLSPDVDEFQSRAASFWLEIIDDPGAGLYVKLWGRMIRGGAAAFPDINSNRNIIPLGIVETSPDSSDVLFFGIYQIQWGNLVNRYAKNNDNFTPPGPLQLPIGVGGFPAYFRGDWDIDNLTGQVFYPGEIVKREGNPLYLKTMIPFAQFNVARAYYVHSDLSIETHAPPIPTDSTGTGNAYAYWQYLTEVFQTGGTP